MLLNEDRIVEYLADAKAIAWDTCHKIYVLMDDEQVALMQSYGYDPLIRAGIASPGEMLTYLRNWWDESCSLRFINAVRTVDGDPNDGFENLIAQFEEYGEESVG